MSRAEKKERLAELKEEATGLIEVQRRSDADRIAHAIKLGRIMREAKELLKSGGFGKWCIEEIGYEKSHRNDAMKLFDHRNEISAAQQWAIERGIPATTMSDVIKMLPKWRRRNDPAPTPSKHRRYSVADITDDQRFKIHEAHTCLSTEQIDDIQVVRAENLLLKLTVAYRVTVDRLLKAVGLKAPPQWEAHIQEEAFGNADTSDGIEATVMPVEPDLTPALSSGGSVLPEVPSNDVGSSENPPPSSVETENPLSSKPIGSQRYRSIPAFDRLSTGKRASRKLCETGLDTIIKLGRSGTNYTRISTKLKALDLKVSSAQISSILMRDKSALPIAA